MSLFRSCQISPQSTASRGVSEEGPGSKSGRVFVRWLPWRRSGKAKVAEKGGIEEKDDYAVKNANGFGSDPYKVEGPVGNV